MLLIHREGLKGLEGKGLHNYVKDCFIYNKETGTLLWNPDRPSTHFKSKRAESWWKSNFAGKNAGSLKGGKYLQVGINHKRYLIHRVVYLIVEGVWPSGVIDHIDGDGLNNKWSNLRNVTNTLNARNAKMFKTNTSGFVGVSWQKTKNLWKAYGYNKVNGVSKQVILLETPCKEDAVKARKDWEESEGNFTERHGK